MSITVGENTAREMGLTRLDVDEWAAYSHGQAIASIDSGAFEEEIVPVEYTDREGNARVFSVDEHPRRGTTVETLAELKPLHPEIDGADRHRRQRGRASTTPPPRVVLTADDYAEAHGLRPLARVVSWASSGVEPARTGMGPTLAIPKALERAGLTIDDIDLFEINEAFCSVPVAAIRTLGIDPDDRERQRQRLQPRSPDRGDRRPHGRHHGQRAAPPRARPTASSRCAPGGGMGSALVLEVA